MRRKPDELSNDAEKTVRDIKRATRRHFGAEDKIRIVIAGLRGEESIAELCRKEGIHQNLYYRWSKEFLEAGKKRLDSIAIPHQIAWRCIPSERLSDLSGNPLRRRMRRYGIVNELPSAVLKEYQTAEQLESDRRHDKQVSGGDPCRMVAQERRPALTRLPGAVNHVLGHGRLGDFDTELEELAMDSGCAP